MANVERLTKRVKKIEEWIEENKDFGGPQGVLETMNFLINEARTLGQKAQQWQHQFNDFRNLTFEFLKENKMDDNWDKFLEDKENALQEQETESLPVRDESEASEGVREEDTEEQETTE